MGSLSAYFDAALRLAAFEEMEENSGWFATIEGFEGLWASGDTEQNCRTELRSTLEDWVLFSLQRQMPIPLIHGVDLNRKPSEAA